MLQRYVKLTFLLCFIIGFGVIQPTKAQFVESPWPAIRADAQNTGASTAPGPQSDSTKWVLDLPYTIGDDDPTIGADGTIYVTNYDSLFAYHPDGSLKWRMDVATSDIRSVQVGEHALYTIARDLETEKDSLYALNKDGTIKWGKQVPSIEHSPTIGPDGTLYVGTRTPDSLLAINQDGTIQWAYKTRYEVESHPAIGSDSTIYFSTTNDLYQDEYVRVFALNPDGSKKWHFNEDSLHAEGFTSPVIGPNGTIYVTTVTGSDQLTSYLLALNPDGTMKWSIAWGNTPSVDRQGNLYYTESDTLYSYAPDKSLRWSKPGIDHRPIIDSEGTLYSRKNDTTLVALDSSGEVLWTKTFENSVEFRSIGTDRTMYAFEHWHHNWYDDINKLHAIGAGTSTDIADRDGSSPEGYKLKSNYPNPFNPSTRISFTLPRTANVTLAVYDILGRKVQTLVDGKRKAGHHTITFNAENLPSGMYIYHLEAGNFEKSRKMTLVK